MTTNNTPAAPAGWYVSNSPTEGALVVPLWCTEQDVAEAAERGALSLTVTKTNSSTGRATARRYEGGPAVPVVYSSRGGGGWRQGGRWVQFATPRLPEPAPEEQVAEQPSYEAVPLADEPQPLSAPHTTPRPQLPAWLRDAQADAARRDRNRAARAAADAANQAATERAEREEAAFATYLADTRRTTRPAWLYGAAAGTEGEPTEPDTQLADDAPDTTPRPAPSVYARAATAAARWLREHEAGCVRCATNQWSRCPRGEGLARRAGDAQQAADSALAVVADRPDTNR